MPWPLEHRHCWHQSQRNHKDCCGIHCSQTQKYPSNWCPTSPLNKNTLSYKSYLIQFEEMECHIRCADLIKTRRYERKQDACEEKITTQKQIWAKEAHAVLKKKLSNDPEETQRHKRDTRCKELRNQHRVWTRSSPKTNHKENQSS